MVHAGHAIARVTRNPRAVRDIAQTADIITINIDDTLHLTLFFAPAMVERAPMCTTGLFWAADRAIRARRIIGPDFA
jgi:hypothetical protein